MSAYIIGILSTGDTYRLALKGILPLSPSVLTYYRFSRKAPTKHHSGLAAPQRVAVKLACFVLFLQWQFYFISFYLPAHDSVGKVPFQLQLHTFTPLLLDISKLHEPLLRRQRLKQLSPGRTRRVDKPDLISSWWFSPCRLSLLSSPIRKHFSGLG